MINYHEEKILILTKTYPSPSTKYRETSCVAGINDSGEMRRLFPVPYRLLSGELQFNKWQWIKASIKKAEDDHRPESYHIDVDTIVRLQKVSTNHNWAERISLIQDKIVNDFSILINQSSTLPTLGFVKPISFRLQIKDNPQPDWTDSEKNKLIRDGLFDSIETLNRTPLEKIPYDFYYEYTCNNNGIENIYKHKIIDWEACELYRNCRSSHGDQWEIPFRKKLEEEFSRKDLILLMGNMHRFPTTWLIVGLVYPPRVNGMQLPLGSMLSNV
jgi:hypothetical protein